MREPLDHPPRVRGIVILTLVIAGLPFTGGRALAADEAAVTTLTGRELFLKKCASCHGENGDGKGELVHMLATLPRDFRLGVYKLRSTRTGSLPTDDDLVRVIRQGVPGTAMKGFQKSLSPDQMRSLLPVLKGFAERFRTETAGAPIQIPAPPEFTSDLVSRGARIYEKMKCEHCHGAGGKGDGPSAASLKDSQGTPIRPYDLTVKGHMKSGAQPQDIYRAFSTGLDGTPMPDYSDSLTPEERWQLVAFILSLQEDKPAR